MTRVFSWRDQLIVEVEDKFRINATDEVLPTIEEVIKAINTDMGGDSDHDLLCVIHNGLYWQCECGWHLLGLDSKHKAAEWLSQNLGFFIKQCEMMKFGDDGEPDRRSDPNLQVANCEPLYGTKWKNVGLAIELKNGIKFSVKIEVVE